MLRTLVACILLLSAADSWASKWHPAEAQPTITIKWPDDREIGCTADNKPVTDVVLSISGLALNQQYGLESTPIIGGGWFSVWSGREAEKSILLRDVRAADYRFDLKIQHSKGAVAASVSAEFGAKPPRFDVVTQGAGLPITASVDGVVVPLTPWRNRGELLLVVVPAYFPDNEPKEKALRWSRIEECKQAEFKFEGLPAGNYEARLVYLEMGEGHVLARRPLPIGLGTVAVASSPEVNNPGGSGGGTTPPATIIGPSVHGSVTAPAGSGFAAPTTFACTQAQRQLAAEFRAAYGGNMDQIAAVARDADYALLSSAVYQGAAALETAKERGWTHPTSGVERGLLSGSMEYSVFERGDQTVVAFQGTNPDQFRDLLTDITVLAPILFLGQIKDAENIADWAVSKYPNRKVVFVGHSLGGRLAQVAALKTGREAVVFDTSPLSNAEMPNLLMGALRDTPPMRAYRGPQDPISAPDSRQYALNTIVVRNIFEVDDWTLPGFSHLDFTHSHEVLARAMGDVRQTYESGGFSCLE